MATKRQQRDPQKGARRSAVGPGAAVPRGPRKGDLPIRASMDPPWGCPPRISKNLAEIGQVWSTLAKLCPNLAPNWPNLGPHRPDLADFGPTVGSRSNSPTTLVAPCLHLFGSCGGRRDRRRNFRERVESNSLTQRLRTSIPSASPGLSRDAVITTQVLVVHGVHGRRHVRRCSRVDAISPLCSSISRELRRCKTLRRYTVMVQMLPQYLHGDEAAGTMSPLCRLASSSPFFRRIAFLLRFGQLVVGGRRCIMLARVSHVARCVAHAS